MIGNLKKFKFLQIMIKTGTIQVMEIILLSRMTILMNVCIVSVDHALQMREIDSFGRKTDNHREHERNSQLRKEKYKRFWTNLFHRGVWKDPRYLEQKHVVLRRDFRRKKYIYHRRDLMSKCVIELVRHWYPNLQDKEYMGHMWE
jgi:hypothetical protein